MSEYAIPCSIKSLPQEQWIEASNNAIRIYPGNAPAVQQFAMALSMEAIQPLFMAVVTTKYWGPVGAHLTVGFMDNPPTDLKARILAHMNAWSQHANVSFVESAIEPRVRITRDQVGYWSYLGTDIDLIAKNKPTLCLQGFTMNTPESEFHRVVRHETGHTLGFPHEHMRIEIVNGIDRDKAIAYFMRTQGWTRDQVISQVLTPLDSSALMATTEPDPNSIMCYSLPGDIMKNGKPVPGGRDIDALDAQFAASIYPKTKAA